MRSFAISLFFVLCSAEAAKAIGTVRKRTPEGVLYYPAFSNTPAKLKLSQKIFDRDRLVTDAGGKIWIELFEKGDDGKPNTFVLGADSELSLQSALDGSAGLTLNLNRGSVFCDVRKRYSGSGEDEFRVQTPHAVSGVRGTKFHVTTSSSQMSVVVVSARLGSGVEVRKNLLNSGDSKLLLAGEVLNIGPADLISELQPSTAALLSKDLRDSLVSDLKFSGNTVPKELLRNSNTHDERKKSALVIEKERYSGMKHSGSFFRDIRGQIRSEVGTSRAETSLDLRKLKDSSSELPEEAKGKSQRSKQKEQRFLSVERALKEQKDAERTERIKKRGQKATGLDRYRVVEGDEDQIKTNKEAVENAPGEKIQARSTPDLDESTKELINDQNQERANIRKTRDALKNPPLN